MNDAQAKKMENGIADWGPLPYEVVSSEGLGEGWCRVIVSRPSAFGPVVRYLVCLQPNGAPFVMAVK